MGISVLGTGMMGAALAARLIAVGYQVTVYNRTAAKAAPLVEQGARLATTVGEALDGADAVLIVMADAESTRQTLFATETVPHLAGRRLMCVATTSEEEVVALAADVAAHGGTLGEVSVMVAPDDIAAGRGQFIVGCAAEDEALWEGVFSKAGEWVYRAGKVGKASQCDKAFIAPFVFNMLGAAYTAAVGSKLGVPPAILSKMLTDNPILTITGASAVLPLIEARKYPTTIANVDAMRHAITMLVDSAKALGVSTAALDPVALIYDQAAADGFSGDDAAAAYEVLIKS